MNDIVHVKDLCKELQKLFDQYSSYEYYFPFAVNSVLCKINDVLIEDIQISSEKLVDDISVIRLTKKTIESTYDNRDTIRFMCILEGILFVYESLHHAECERSRKYAVGVFVSCR